MNMTSTVHLMGNVVQQSEAPDYMINDIHSKTNDKYSTHIKAIYQNV